MYNLPMTSQAMNNPMGGNPMGGANSAAPQQTGIQPSQVQPMQPIYNMNQSYAHGGSVDKRKAPKMIMAHMNKKELNVLDHLQGKKDICPRTGMRRYSHIEEILKNPHILSAFHDHTMRHHHANGGRISQSGMVGPGVHGDTEIALIGPHTHQVFSAMAKKMGFKEGDLVNPYDGRPQYWSLGGMLGGAWDAIKGGAGKAWDVAKDVAPTIGRIGASALPYLGTAAGGALGTFLGNPELGMVAGGKLGEWGGNALRSLSEGAGESKLSPEMTNALGEGLGNFGIAHGANYIKGGNPSALHQSIGSGLNAFGESLTKNHPNEYVSNIGGNLSSVLGTHLEDSPTARQGIGRTIHAAGEAFGDVPGAKPILQGIGNGIQAGTGLRGIAGNVRNNIQGMFGGNQQQAPAPQNQQADPYNAQFGKLGFAQ